MNLQKNLNRASRKLTQILRYLALKLGLDIDKRGFVSVDQLLALGLKEFEGITYDDIIAIVNSNEKKRFELINNDADGNLLIRATQGHSKEIGMIIDDEEALEKIEEPLENLFHGTEEEFLQSILMNGLKRMKRKHIHFVETIHEDQQTSGFKSKSNKILKIDMAKCMEDGIAFFKSSNGVILTEGFDGIIPPEYIFEVIDR